MSLLDMATAQPYSQRDPYAISRHPYFCKKFDYGNQKRWPFSWSSFSVPGKGKKFNSGKIEVFRGGLVISAAASFKCVEVGDVSEQLCGYPKLKIGFDSCSSTPMTTEEPLKDEDAVELDEREKLRRMRISKANKGNTPWNKGRKHSAETLRRIKEKTRLAMQDPKVKMKLVILGHAQSEETRVKIGVGVRIGWEKRREKLMLQETCYYEWQNVIADASKKGLLGEEELQWDSYTICNEQLGEEWLQRVEKQKKMKRPNGSKRAPKSDEQRKKISEAISAKWADPATHAKVHGIPEGVVRKPRRKAGAISEPRKSVPNKNANDDEDELATLESSGKSQIQRVKMRKTRTPLFNDPLSSSKLDMLKNIRAERAAAEYKKSEAVARAKALITGSVNALKALEAAAENSLLAQASLTETRKLISEAKQLMKSIENDELASSELLAYPEEEELDDTDRRKINGSKLLTTNENSIDDHVPGKCAMHNKVNGEKYEGFPLKSEIHDLQNGNRSLSVSSSDYDISAEELNNVIKHSGFRKDLHGVVVNGSLQNAELPLTNRIGAEPEENEPPSSMYITKKWVRGRLVEMDSRREFKDL